MKYTEQNKLTKAQQKEVKTLLDRCREKESFSLSFPMHEPHTKFFLAEDEDGTVRGAVHHFCSHSSKNRFRSSPAA